MLNKQEALESLRQLSIAGQVTDAEVAAVMRGGMSMSGQPAAVVASVEPSKHSLSLSKALYFIGGSVILIGIIILVVQNWESMSSAIQLLVTLGMGVAAFVAGILLRGRPGLTAAARVFTGIGGILLPIGIGVLLDLLGVSLMVPKTHIFVAAGLLVVFAGTLALLRDPIHAFFSVLFGTWMYGAVIAYLMMEGGAMYLRDFPQYAIMVLGLGYLFISHALRTTEDYYYRRLAMVLSAFGLVAILGPALSMGGIWDLLYPFVVFGIMFASVYLHNGTYLKVGSFFLMVYLIKISAQYFSDSFGWPLALVFAGFMLMGVGYLTFYLNKKYIKTPAVGQPL